MASIQSGSLLKDILISDRDVDTAMASTEISPSQLAQYIEGMRSSDWSRVSGLLKVLDEVAQIHPFIQPLIRVFRVAFELYFAFKLREVDRKRIILGFVEMRDMMGVLVRLRDIPADVMGRGNGTTIAARMKPLLEATVEDIKIWANLSDAYVKTKHLIKVIRSTSWDAQFKKCIETFASRRHEFEDILSTYIRIATVDQKIDRVLKHVMVISLPAKECEHRQGVEVFDRNTEASEDAKLEGSLEIQCDSGGVSCSRTSSAVVDEAAGKKKTVEPDVQSAIHENMEQFQRKFTIYRRELEGKVPRTMQNESGLIAGPHAQILDPDIQEIWKEMRWRGRVKGHHFVLALRGYFRDRFDQRRSAKGNARPTVATRQLSDKDEPTLEYINTTRAQPVIEAFDDDGSGFITLAEVNMFTNARPENWSLLHWLAYWAVGFQVFMSSYAAKIDDFLSQMAALRPLVLPENRAAVDHYVDYVWARTVMLTSAFRRAEIDEEIRRNFEEYAQAEEERLSQNLETVKYTIDGRETLQLVCGPGRIEKHIFPLLYVLLKRDLEVLHLVGTQVLHGDKLSGSRSTISHVFDAVDDRHQRLTALFKQRKLDPALHFRTFASEMFKYWGDTDASKIPDIALLKMSQAHDIEPTSFSNVLQEPREEVAESSTGHLPAVHGDVLCDACGDPMNGMQIVCLSWETEPMIHLCGKEPCLGSEVRQDHKSPHLPAHDVMKIRAATGHPCGKIAAEVYRMAQKALVVARQSFVDSVSSNTPGESDEARNRQPTCVGCGEQVSQPFWYCAECEEPCFVCMSCDTTSGGISSREHTETHALVRCQYCPEFADANLNPENELSRRMNTLERRLTDMDAKVAEGFAAQERKTAALDERLKHIEDLLLNLGERSLR